MTKQYIDSEDVRRQLKEMHDDAANTGNNIFELIHEDRVRTRLTMISGISQELIDATILALIKAQSVRKNLITTFPLANSEGVACCALCHASPVVLPLILVPDRDPIPEKGEEDVSFVSYVCAKHADNTEATHKEVQETGLLWRLGQERKKMLGR